MILQAAEEVGFVKRIEKFDDEGKSIGFEPVSTSDEGVKGYLKWAAVHQPARFLAMLTRRPGSETDVRYRTYAQVVADLRKVGYSEEKIQWLIEDLRK